MNKIDINVGVFGASSVGKSMFVNSLCGKYYSEVSISKKFYIPQIYKESEQACDSKDVKHHNARINKWVLEDIWSNKFNIDTMQWVIHPIGEIKYLHNKEATLIIHDLPCLDDERTQDVYFCWIEEQEYDLIIFIIDIEKGIDEDSKYILNYLINLSKINNCQIVYFVNKCDDLYYDKDIDDLLFSNDEHEQSFIKCNRDLNAIVDNENNIGDFFPISSKNYFVNQFLNENNESNQLYHTGFFNVFEIIKNKIDNIQIKKRDKYLKLLKDKMINDINNLENPITDISKYVDEIIYINYDINELKNYNIGISEDLLWNRFKETIEKYVTDIININTKIIIDDDYIGFEKFDVLHSTMLQYCIDFECLMNSIKNIDGYPKEFFESKYITINNKLFHLYDQLCTVGISRTHVCPMNLLRYLQIIKSLCPEKFFIYSSHFLYFSTNCENHYVQNKNDLINLILFIKENTLDFNQLKCYLTSVMVSRKSYILQKYPHKSLSYLFKIQDIIKNNSKTNNETKTLIGNFEQSIDDIIKRSNLSLIEIDFDINFEEQMIKLLIE